MHDTSRSTARWKGGTDFTSRNDRAASALKSLNGTMPPFNRLLREITSSASPCIADVARLNFSHNYPSTGRKLNDTSEVLSTPIRWLSHARRFTRLRSSDIGPLRFEASVLSCKRLIREHRCLRRSMS